MRKVRASLLPNLQACQMLFLSKYAEDNDGTGGSNRWADTGNIYHRLAAALHLKRSIPAAFKRAKKDFPQGDPDEAMKLFEDYKSYAPKGAVLSCETEKYTEFAGFKFTGTIDLVIREKGSTTSKVVDHKTGKASGAEMIRTYRPQLAVYTWIVYKETLQWPETYINHARQGRMLRVEFTMKEVETLLHEIVEKLIGIESRVLPHTPGPHCRYCNVTGCKERSTTWSNPKPIGQLPWQSPPLTQTPEPSQPKRVPLLQIPLQTRP